MAFHTMLKIQGVLGTAESHYLKSCILINITVTGVLQGAPRKTVINSGEKGVGLPWRDEFRMEKNRSR